MTNKIKIGILKETKTPPDRRVALPPKQVKILMEKFDNVEVVVQPSDIRCFKDEEYTKLGIILQEDISNCDLLIGVKETKIPTIIPNKTYIEFAHIAKKQPHNLPLIRAFTANKNTLIDYEYFTDKKGVRLVAFGHWAGIVGAYNALRALSIKEGLTALKPANQMHDYSELKAVLQTVKIPAKKFIVTGGGRVAGGAVEILTHIGASEVTTEDFLGKSFNTSVYCRLDPWHYAKHKKGNEFVWDNWVNNPMDFESTFLPYTKKADVMIACHYWDYRSPHFFTLEDMASPDFNISVIADVSCDIPGPIPSTIKASTIADPFYDFNPKTQKEEPAFSRKGNVTMMTIDNLPGELPRDASEFFGNLLIEKVLPHILCDDCEQVIERATILKNGILTKNYSYLQDFLDGKE
ncbi:MAG TPA: NAD(P)-dependent oxidoreductase [Tenuifilaceae bacterium]|nr:NAD(P)-dependent oxidoreductase [Tenuifilaceae bacterium]